MLHSEKLSIYRFNLETPVHIPLAVRSVGRYALVPGSQVEPPMKKNFSEIFWSETGVGEFLLGRRWVRVKGCELFYLLPGEVHHIRPMSRPWVYHWFTLDHELSARMLGAFGLIERPMPTQRCPVEIFEELRKLVGNGTLEGDREASHRAHATLLSVMENMVSLVSRPPWFEQCKRRIDENYADPQLGVEELAEGAGVHRATLFRAFVRAYGMTPSRYLQNRRLHEAVGWLKNSDLSVKEVAARVGMADANYLARLVRRMSGMSPLGFRAMNR